MNDLSLRIITGIVVALSVTAVVALWKSLFNSNIFYGRKIKKLLKHNRILWVGPSGSGKTSLLCNLVPRELYEETSSTTHGIEVPILPSMEKAKIIVTDSPLSLKKQSVLVSSFQPTILLVQVSMDSEEHKNWLRDFVDNLVQAILGNPSNFKKLRRIIIVLAQSDRFQQQKPDAYKESIEKIINEQFKPLIISNQDDHVIFLTCSLIIDGKFNARKILHYIMSGIYLNPIIQCLVPA